MLEGKTKKFRVSSEMFLAYRRSFEWAAKSFWHILMDHDISLENLLCCRIFFIFFILTSLTSSNFIWKVKSLGWRLTTLMPKIDLFRSAIRLKIKVLCSSFRMICSSCIYDTGLTCRVEVLKLIKKLLFLISTFCSYPKEKKNPIGKGMWWKFINRKTEKDILLRLNNYGN